MHAPPRTTHGWGQQKRWMAGILHTCSDLNTTRALQKEKKGGGDHPAARGNQPATQRLLGQECLAASLRWLCVVLSSVQNKLACLLVLVLPYLPDATCQRLTPSVCEPVKMSLPSMQQHLMRPESLSSNWRQHV